MNMFFMTTVVFLAVIGVAGNGFAQERTANGSLAVEANWAALKNLVDKSLYESKIVSVRVDQISICNKKAKFYAPGTSGADADGCNGGLPNCSTQQFPRIVNGQYICQDRIVGFANPGYNVYNGSGFQIINWNNGTNVNSNIFTAPYSGYFLFQMAGGIALCNDAVVTSIYVNGIRTWDASGADTQSGKTCHASMNHKMYLNQNDKVTLRFYSTGGPIGGLLQTSALTVLAE